MEIKNRILFYNDFAPNQTSTSILKTIYDYLKKQGLYMLLIIDIMLSACATALNVNIRVWQNDNGFKNILQFDVYLTPSQKTIHLLYTRALNAEGTPDASLDPNNLCHHYDALILKSGTVDDEEDDGLFPSDEEYMGNSLTQETLISITTTTTSNCLHFSKRQWCGALRASMWDCERNIMTVWHQGKHICLLKKPPLEKDNAMKMVMMLKNIM